MDAPRIETERLVLRAHGTADYASCLALWGNPIVTRHIGNRTHAPQEVWARVLRYIGHWHALDFGCWVVEERDTGRFAGEVGFAIHKRAIEPPFGDAWEIGWVLAPWCHGRGYATEAALASLAWASQSAPGHRSVCLIDADNAPSIRVAARCGYRELARTTYDGAAAIVYDRAL
ncbi:MAG: GNAT family N-acetyltransferase [Deltaproteobacteria bacterium]|nr:GNAT family N-acetyltransferase [Deltaproteobacteria bacterium]